MRRSMLTAGSPVTGLVVGASVGTSGIGGADTFVSLENPAVGTGTLTSVNTNFSSTPDFWVYTVDASTNQIRAVSSLMTAVSGAYVYSVSLSIVTGDYIGITTNGVSSARYSTTGGTGGGFYTKTIGTTPTVGTNVISGGTLTAAPARLNLSGTI